MAPHAGTTINSPVDRITHRYDAHIFGQRMLDIGRDMSMGQCNTARGADYISGPYKQGILVEANAAFDVRSTPESMDNFKRDAEKKIDCAPVDDDQSTYKTDIYWGKNIMTNVNSSDWTLLTPSNI